MTPTPPLSSFASGVYSDIGGMIRH
jgi:hypothetical protein